MLFSAATKTDLVRVFSFPEWVLNPPLDISPAAVVVTPFYSSTMVMTVIVSKIPEFFLYFECHFS